MGIENGLEPEEQLKKFQKIHPPSFKNLTCAEQKALLEAVVIPVGNKVLQKKYIALRTVMEAKRFRDKSPLNLTHQFRSLFGGDIREDLSGNYEHDKTWYLQDFGHSYWTHRHHDLVLKDDNTLISNAYEMLYFAGSGTVVPGKKMINSVSLQWNAPEDVINLDQLEAIFTAIYNASHYPYSLGGDIIQGANWCAWGLTRLMGCANFFILPLLIPALICLAGLVLGSLLYMAELLLKPAQWLDESLAQSAFIEDIRQACSLTASKANFFSFENRDLEERVTKLEEQTALLDH